MANIDEMGLQMWAEQYVKGLGYLATVKVQPEQTLAAWSVTLDLQNGWYYRFLVAKYVAVEGMQYLCDLIAWNLKEGIHSMEEKFGTKQKQYTFPYEWKQYNVTLKAPKVNDWLYGWLYDDPPAPAYVPNSMAELYGGSDADSNT